MSKNEAMIEIELGGEKRTLHFSTNFWAIFTDTVGVAMQDIGQIISVDEQDNATISLAHFRDMIYAALAAYDHENARPVDYTNYTVGVWMDNFTDADRSKLLGYFTKTKFFGISLDSSK